MKMRWASILLAALLVAGCASREGYARKRTAGLLAVYPPKVTTSAEVNSKWLGLEPEITAVCPTNGWQNIIPPYVGARCLAVERRTGQHVYRCDRMPDIETSGVLGHCWFYFDDANRLIDAEWRYATDQTPLPAAAPQ
jgi:hypothetical protein